MKPAQAKAVLELLLNGIDPVTGECLDDDHVCAQPLVMRALHSAIGALEGRELPPAPEEAPPKRKRIPTSVPWTNAEDDKLRTLRRTGHTVAQVLGLMQERSPQALIHRMLFLGLIGSKNDAGIALRPGQERVGTRWYPEDDAKLKELFGKNVDADEIAKEMKRSRYAIACRLEKLGLIGNREEIGGKRG